MAFNIFENIPKSVEEITPDFLRENFVYDEFKVRSSLLRKSNFKAHNQLGYYSMLRTFCRECETMDDMVRRMCNIIPPLNLVKYPAETTNIKDYILKYLCFPNTTIMIAQRIMQPILEKYGILEPLESYYSDSSCIHETIYRIINDIDTRPVCVECGKPVNYSKQFYFSRFCCKKCQNSNEEMRKKNSASVSKALKEVWANRKKEQGISINSSSIPKQSSFHLLSQTEITDRVKVMLNELGLNNTYIINDRSAISPYHIDIFFPLEMKGIIFINNILDNEEILTYKKTCNSNAEENSIELIFVYEHLLVKKPDLFKQYVDDFYKSKIEPSLSTLI